MDKRKRERKKRNISNVCIETKLIFVNLNEIPWAIHHNYYWHWNWKSLLKLFVTIWVWCCSPVTIHRLSALAHFSRLRLLAISVLHGSMRTVDAKRIESTFKYLSVSRRRKYFFSSFLDAIQIEQNLFSFDLKNEDFEQKKHKIIFWYDFHYWNC